MTDSDSLRGDDRPDQNLPSCCGELEILRALLRPRMTEAGDPTLTAALRGMFIEIERLRSATGDGLLNCDGQTPTRRDIILLPLTKADLEANRGALTNLREQLKGLLDIPLMGPDIDSNICKRIESIKSDLDDARLASQSLAACRHTLETLRGRLHEALGLAMDSNGDKAIFARIESIRRDTLMERQLALASAEGHDHARSLLVEIAEVFGRVDDHRALPKMVKELDEQDKERVIRAAETAAERKRIEGELAIGAEKRDVAAARWTKICEAFGFDHEQDPPISIPAILAGDRWTNTRRMLADACTTMWAPSLEVILGELVQALSKARAPARTDPTCTSCMRRIHDGEKAVQGCSDCYWLEFGDAPPVVVNAIKTDALTRADLPMRARCPVCHRMARVVDGCFQAHNSGDKPCAGSANSSIRRDAVHEWREWLLAKDIRLHTDMHDSHLRVSFDAHAAESRRLTNERIDALQAELGVHTATIEAYEMALHTLGWSDEPKAEEWAKTFANSIALRNLEASGSAMQAIMNLGWTEDSGLPVEWSKTTAAHYKAVRGALGVPADKPIIPYAQHAAKGMQALAILGWQDGSPVEWATKRAAAEADLRGAFAEAELVGSDHAAMVRHMLGHRRSQSSRLSDALARIYQLEIDHSKVHLEGRIELAEKRVAFFRGWALGMAPSGTSNEISDSELISIIQFVPRAD